MKPAHLNISGRQGSTFDWILKIHTLNLTGYKARMTITQPNGDPWKVFSTDDTSPKVTLTTETTTVGQTTTYLSTLTVSIEDETMAEFIPRLYPYDVELEAPGGKTYPLLEGKWAVGPQRRAVVPA